VTTAATPATATDDPTRPSMARQIGGRPRCPACGCDEVDTDTRRCDCVIHADCLWTGQPI
jgi:hypothetical protein